MVHCKIAIGFVLGWVLLIGCTPLDQPCVVHKECGEGNRCIAGKCLPETQCSKGKYCPSSSPVNPQQTTICTPGERHCEGNTVKVCGNSGQDWASLDCGTVHICKEGSCVQRPVSSACGNGIVEGKEECDDGNQISGDGCSLYCFNEKVQRWEAPSSAHVPDTFVLGSRRCADPNVRQQTDKNKVPLYVLIAPVVCRNNNRPVVSASQIRSHIQALNRVFKPAKLNFILGQTRWEDNPKNCEVFYESGIAVIRRYEIHNGLSMFYANNIRGGNFSVAGFANLRGLVLSANTYKLVDVIAHELGHSLGLDHPHECSHGRENPSNCTQAGDQLCDTPNDPGPLGVNGLSRCSDGRVKNGGCKVVGCKIVHCPGGARPLIHNLMSYYHCGTSLTPDQVSVVRCMAFNEQSGRISTRRPCSTQQECGGQMCVRGFCQSGSSSSTCTQDGQCSGSNQRCYRNQCVACTQNGTSVANAQLCCSKQRDSRGTCCQGIACCGSPNNSYIDANRKCRCISGYTWISPNVNGDNRCKPIQTQSCKSNGQWASTNNQCCSKQRDDRGKCCTGHACCAARNHSYTTGSGTCACKHGYTWSHPGASNDRRCKRIPTQTCKKDGEHAVRNQDCCSQERTNTGICCTGNACCGPQNNAFIDPSGACRCIGGYERVQPNSPHDNRCRKIPTSSCKKDGLGASKDTDCCSKERNDRGFCCTGKECCGAQNQSYTTHNKKCRCKTGYTWISPNAQNDFRCKIITAPQCIQNGKSAQQDAACCSKERDAQGRCCMGTSCCHAKNFARILPTGVCQCLAGYERLHPNSPSDVRCKKRSVPTGKTVCTLRKTLIGHTQSIQSVAVSYKGNIVLTASKDGQIRSWNTQTGVLQRTFTGHTQPITSVHFHRNDLNFVSSDTSGAVKRWYIHASTPLGTHQAKGAVRQVRFSPNGAYMTIGSTQQADIWHNNRQIAQNKYPTFSMAYTPSSRSIALGLHDNSVRIYSLSTLKQTMLLKGHHAPVHAIDLSQDGVVIATLSKTLKLWDAGTGTLIQTMTPHTHGAFDVKFHPKKRLFFTGGGDTTIKIWDRQTKTLLQTLSGHSDRITQLSFSADGTILVSASADKTAKIWSCP